MHGLADLADRVTEPLALGHGLVERDDHQGQLAVLRQELAADDLVRLDALDQRIVGGALRKVRREQGGRDVALLRRLAGREERYDAAHAVHQLDVGHEVAQLFERRALQQRLAFHDDEHVELAGREAVRQGLVLLELGRIGAEQLAERVVHLEPRQPEGRGDGQRRDHERRNERQAHGDEADPLQAERQPVRLARSRSIAGGLPPAPIGFGDEHGLTPRISRIGST